MKKRGEREEERGRKMGGGERGGGGGGCDRKLATPCTFLKLRYWYHRVALFTHTAPYHSRSPYRSISPYIHTSIPLNVSLCSIPPFRSILHTAPCLLTAPYLHTPRISIPLHNVYTSQSKLCMQNCRNCLFLGRRCTCTCTCICDLVCRTC